MATAAAPVVTRSDAPLAVRHPAMFRARPVAFVGLACLALAGSAAAIVAKDVPAVGRFALAVVGVLPIALWWLRCWSVTLTITADRTRLRRGIIARHETEVRHSDVRNVAVSQTAWQRLFGIGAIGLSCSGQDGFEIEVTDVIGPAHLKALITTRSGR